MDKEVSIQLTSAEISYLWNTYIADSMSICMFKHFLQHVENPEIKTVVQHALDLSEQHVEMIRGIYNDENIPLPYGFSEQDVNLQAKRLFSDSFYLFYIKHMAKGGLTTYSRILPNMYREDIRAFYSKCLTSTIELNNEATKLLLEKGLAVRPPFIPYPTKAEFIEKQSYIFDGIGKHRPLTGPEVTNLYFNIQTNLIGSSIATAFSQVVKNKKVDQYLLRGKDIALKHIKVFASYLEYNSLPAPMTYDQQVTESTEPPFSEKLMLFHFSLMNYSGIGNYGASMSESQRSDLIIDYSRLLTEVLKFAEDGVNLLIANKWLEKPPSAADREELAKK